MTSKFFSEPYLLISPYVLFVGDISFTSKSGRALRMHTIGRVKKKTIAILGLYNVKRGI